AVLFGVQYANGGTADRPCKILVNGLEQVTSLSMPVTGWTNYQSSETTIQLSTGINEITLVAIDNSGFANIDFYYIYGNATFGTCDMTQTIALNPGWNLFSVSVIDTTGLNGSTDAINFDSTDAINRVSTIFENMDVQIVKNADGFWNPNQP